MGELQVSATKLREALTEAEAYLAKLRDVIESRRALIDDEERMAVRMEQRIASLRWRLGALEAEATMPP